MTMIECFEEQLRKAQYELDNSGGAKEVLALLNEIDWLNNVIREMKQSRRKEAV